MAFNCWPEALLSFCFSPLREGDTSVAWAWTFRPEHIICFSPLREGDTSVANRSASPAVLISWFQSPSRGGHLRGNPAGISAGSQSFGFSPLREGDTSVANVNSSTYRPRCLVSVPFARGTPPWLSTLADSAWCLWFQSPSRGGHLRGRRRSLAPGSSVFVSVPFARGTPPWQPFTLYETMLFAEFQSPSRGGHLRGRSIYHAPI